MSFFCHCLLWFIGHWSLSFSPLNFLLVFCTQSTELLTSKQVKTVEGITELQVPPGTQPGDVLVLAKKGAPKLNKPSIRGDHLFTVKVTIPNRVRYRFILFLFSNCHYNSINDTINLSAVCAFIPCLLCIIWKNSIQLNSTNP